MITILSFGHRYGVPALSTGRVGLASEPGWIVDCRTLRNPHHDRRLRALTGLDQPVIDEVLGHAPAVELLDQQITLATSWASDHDHFTVAFGCTGGRHRSVVLAEELAAELRRRGHQVLLLHRDKKHWK